ncbi:MAG: DNA integrity scanning diadenylate cyclase DisA [Candidatus Aquicultorales bacterium]
MHPLNPKNSEDLLVEALQKVAPGTEMREGLEHILSARTGALLVVGDVEGVEPLCNGGFVLDADFTAERLFELAKMDGAIIVDDNMGKILRANVHLVPDPSIVTVETGTRHRTAERVAKQTKAFVISISQRRDIISLYLNDVKYALQDIRVLLAKANQALQTLEKYRARLDEVSSNLSALEFEDLVTLADVVSVVQRAEMLHRVSTEISRYISELGTEGRLIQMQLDELVGNMDFQTLMLLKDYVVEPDRAGEIRMDLAELSAEAVLDPGVISRMLGYEDITDLEQPIHARGYRLLSKIPRLPMGVVERIIDKFHELKRIMGASLDELDGVEGVGPTRAQAIADGLQRLKEYNILERYI